MNTLTSLIKAIQGRLSLLACLRLFVRSAANAGILALIAILLFKLPSILNWCCDSHNAFLNATAYQTWNHFYLDYFNQFSIFIIIVVANLLGFFFSSLKNSDAFFYSRAEAASKIDLALASKERAASLLDLQTKKIDPSLSNSIVEILSDQMQTPLNQTTAAAIVPIRLSSHEKSTAIFGFIFWTLVLVILLIAPPLSSSLKNESAKELAQLAEKTPELPAQVKEALKELAQKIETKGLDSEETQVSLGKAQQSIDDANSSSFKNLDKQQKDGGGATSSSKLKPTLIATSSPTPTPTATVTSANPKSGQSSSVDVQNSNSMSAPADQSKEAQQGKAENESQESQSQDGKQEKDSKDQKGKQGQGQKQDQQQEQQGGDAESGSDKEGQQGKQNSKDNKQAGQGQGQGKENQKNDQGGKPDANKKEGQKSDQQDQAAKDGLGQAQQALDKLKQKSGGDSSDPKQKEETGKQDSTSKSGSDNQKKDDKKSEQGGEEKNASSAKSPEAKQDQDKKDAKPPAGADGQKPSDKSEKTDKNKEDKETKGQEGKNSAERKTELDREAKLKEAGEGQLGSEGSGLGDKAKFNDAEIKGNEEEKLDQRFTGKDQGQQELKEAIVAPKTSLQELKLAKPETSKQQKEQPIPLEYEGMF